MATPNTKKFSEFVEGTLDEAVGLGNGTNTRGPGGSGSGDVIHTITQDTTGLAPGIWVRRDAGTSKYVAAQGNNAVNAEVVGVVREIINSGSFRLQQAGYIPSGTPGFSGFVDEGVYFISDLTPGLMTLTPPTTNGHVRKSVFEADGPDSGWVICLNVGMVLGSPGPIPIGGSEDTSIRTVNQPGNTFGIGQWVRVDGDMHYTLAQGNNLTNARSVGVVIQNGDPEFTLQFDGFNAGAVYRAYDSAGVLIPGGIVAATEYYISEIVPGELCPTPPLLPTSYSKPVYISESKISGTGYVLDQRPLPPPTSTPGASPLIFLGYLDASNNFSSEDILVDDDGNTYGAYQIILHSGDELAVGYGVRATGLNPINIGLQFFIDGMWQTTLGNYASYMSGVNSTGAINTATMWASVVNGGFVPGRDLAQILPATSTHVGIITGNGILTCAPSSTTLTGSWICVDSAPATPEGYTCIGWSGCDAGTGQATGFRIAFGNGGVLTPGSTSYFIVYGIPNS